MVGHNEHIVDYFNYCRKCKHWNDGKETEPCNECLTYPTNIDTRRPRFFEEDEDL